MGAWRRSNRASRYKTTTDYIPNEFPRAPGRREYCNGAVPCGKDVAKVACSEPKAIASTAGTDWEHFYKAKQPWHATSASTRDGVQCFERAHSRHGPLARYTTRAEQMRCNTYIPCVHGESAHTLQGPRPFGRHRCVPQATAEAVG